VNFAGRHGPALETEDFTGPGKNRIPGNFEMDAFKAIERLWLCTFHHVKIVTEKKAKIEPGLEQPLTP
jgi:hypothetical protein